MNKKRLLHEQNILFIIIIIHVIIVMYNWERIFLFTFEQFFRKTRLIQYNP